ncbi:MAG: glycosyl transferase group 1 [Proteobacteria bacterium]|nr:glycosyl transferase group 1 [Pseudomonadota bacterium]
MIIYISRSLSPKVLKTRETTSSSQLFELGFFLELSKKREVFLITVGDVDVPLEFIGGVGCRQIKYRGFFRGGALMRCLINSGEEKKDKVILNTGYNPLDLFVILIYKTVFDAKNYCFVYDNHRQSIKFFGWLKKIILNIYFGFGFLLLRMCTGLIVLNDEFIRCENIKNRYLKIQVGAAVFGTGRRLANNVSHTNVFLVAGTLNDENGIGLVIDYLNSVHDDFFEFHFYGDGVFVQKIKDLALVDKRVRYFGRVTKSLLNQRISAADFLVNLRDPNGVSSAYSFPSKLIDFMGAGVPVLSNFFPGLEKEYLDCMCVVDEFSVKEFSVAVNRAVKMSPSDRVALGISARELIKKNNNWEKIVDDFVCYVFEGA